MVRSALTVPEKAELWRRYRAGESLRSISRTLGRGLGTLRILVASTGGVSRRSRGDRRCGCRWQSARRFREESRRATRVGRSLGTSGARHPPSRARSQTMVVGGVTVGARRNKRRSSALAVPNRRSSRPTLDCGSSLKLSSPCGGLRSRFPAGSCWCIRAIESYTCLMRRSTCRCSCNRGASCARS